MNTQSLKGNWNEVKGLVKRKWAKLTNDELDQIEGKYEELVGRIQKHYGKQRDEIQRELDELLDKL